MALRRKHHQVAVIFAGSLGEETNSSGAVCDEICLVGEGETLHAISEKCVDPFIVERNPHIPDPVDVFPGLMIKITPVTVSSKYYCF